MHDEFAESGAPHPPMPLRQRDGSNPIERKAVFRAQVEIGSMPASFVVQIALWPDKLADWAKDNGISPAVVYNMLAGVKPYHRVRSLLARRLDVPKAVLDHLVDAPRPEPVSRIPPDPPVGFVPDPGVPKAAPGSAAGSAELQSGKSGVLAAGRENAVVAARSDAGPGSRGLPVRRRSHRSAAAAAAQIPLSL